MKKIEKILVPLIFWFVIFWGLSLIVNNPILFPSPYAVLVKMSEKLISYSFWLLFFKTGLKIVFALILSQSLGVIFAYLSYRSSFMRGISDSFMAFVKTSPVAVLTIILLVWLPASLISIFLVILVVLPQTYLSLLSSLDNIDRDVREMLDIFRVGSKNRLKYVYGRLMFQTLLSSFSFVWGFAWKSGISGEIISQARQSFGNLFYQAKIYLEIDELFAYSILLVLLTFLLEKLILYLIRRIYYAEA